MRSQSIHPSETNKRWIDKREQTTSSLICPTPTAAVPEGIIVYHYNIVSDKIIAENVECYAFCCLCSVTLIFGATK